MSRVLAVIPARYASTRFPGKPLALLGGKPIVDYAYAAAQATPGIAAAVVATDDERIFSHMEQTFGKDSVMMTSPNHQSGTDRCGEVLAKIQARGENYDVVINLQGDEPFVEAAQLTALVECFDSPEVEIATLKTRIRSVAELLSPNNVKVVCASDGRALYFSRQPIPFRRGVDTEAWLDGAEYYKHVGIYAFRATLLPTLCSLGSAALEESEKLEQLRWLAAGYRIHVVETPHANIGIDTPEDLAAAEAFLEQRNKETNK